MLKKSNLCCIYYLPHMVMKNECLVGYKHKDIAKCENLRIKNGWEGAGNDRENWE